MATTVPPALDLAFVYRFIENVQSNFISCRRFQINALRAYNAASLAVLLWDILTTLHLEVSQLCSDVADLSLTLLLVS